MKSVGNEEAFFVAECLLDYGYEQERRKKEQKEQYLQRKKELKHTRKSVAVLTAVASAMLCLCITMIRLDMQVKNRESNISDLKAEVMELKKQNAEAQKRLTNTTDYQWVRQEALKLGMTQITADRVIYYTVEAGDYMVQYADIPQDTR